MKGKVIVLPVYQRHWLYQAWAESTAKEAAAERVLHWTQGETLQDRASLLGKELGRKLNRAAQQQWKSIEAADEGTFKHRLYTLAKWVLSQEDPTETFLKSIPRNVTTLEVVHPSSVQERLVRRRMRRLAAAQEHYHNRRILGWALATLPQLPLVITPFPNVTLYYTAYKLYSHYMALQGCRTLRGAFERYDAAERERARRGVGAGVGGLRALLSRLAAGSGGACGGSGSGGGRDDGSGGCSMVGGRGAGSPPSGAAGAGNPRSPSSAGSPSGPEAPLPVFLPSRSLDSVVRPLDRWHSPLSDEMALRVRDLFTPPAHAAKAVKTAAGAKAKQGAKQGAKGKDGDADGAGDEGAGGLEALPELVARLRHRVMEAGGTRKRR